MEAQEPTTTPSSEEDEIRLVRAAVARLRASLIAAIFATVGGTGLWVATVWLLVQGGENVGPHLGLLGNYMPGYTVTWRGAFLGFFYGGLVGGVSGWLLAWVYNTVADRRKWSPRSQA